MDSLDNNRIVKIFLAEDNGDPRFVKMNLIEEINSLSIEDKTKLKNSKQ